MSALLLGVGNILLSDEAIGVRTVEAFQERFNFPDALDVVDGGTAGMELLDLVSNRDLIIIVDAVKKASSPSGTIIRLYDEEVPRLLQQKVSPHQLGLSDLLSALFMLDQYPKKLVVIGIVPQSIEPHIGLTDTIANRLDDLLETVVQELTAHDIAITAHDIAITRPVCSDQVTVAN